MLNILLKQTLQTELSLWYTPLCILIGIGGAWMLYSKKAPWSKSVNRLLFALRALILTLIWFLLLGPLLNQITFQNEDPVAVILIDNSSSIRKDSTINVVDQIKRIQNQLESEGLKVRLRNLDVYFDDINELDFNSEATDLNSALKAVRQDYEQQNLAAVVLVSDGIHNYGISPQFLPLNYPVYSLGLGDTIPEKDLSIKRLNYNKVVYQGNRFPIVVDIFNNGYVGERINLSVSKQGQVLENQSFILTGDQQVNTFEFILETEDLGIEIYTAAIQVFPDESSIANNRRRAL